MVQMFRRLAILLLAALALLVVNGCRVDVAVDVDVAANGSGTITVTATADKAVVDEAPGVANDLRFDDLAAQGWTATPATPTADGGLQVVLQRGFATVEDANTLLAGLNGERGPFHDLVVGRTAEDGRVTLTVSGSALVEGGLEAFSDSALTNAVGATPWEAAVQRAGVDPAQAVGITLRFTLPGEITSTGTTADGATTWVVPIGGAPVDVRAAATASESAGGGAGGGGSSWFWSAVKWLAIIALVVWLVAAAAFILYVAQVRKRRARRRNVLMAHRARNL